MALILGMGEGFFTIVVFLIVSSIAWYLASHTNRAVVYNIIIFIVNLLLIFFFIFAPKGEDVDEYGQKRKDDPQFWSRFATGLILFIVCVPLALLVGLLEWATVPIRNSKPQDTFVTYTMSQ